jgi:hypothetical protein
MTKFRIDKHNFLLTFEPLQNDVTFTHFFSLFEQAQKMQLRKKEFGKSTSRDYRQRQRQKIKIVRYGAEACNPITGQSADISSSQWRLKRNGSPINGRRKILRRYEVWQRPDTRTAAWTCADVTAELQQKPEVTRKLSCPTLPIFCVGNFLEERPCVSTCGIHTGSRIQ